MEASKRREPTGAVRLMWPLNIALVELKKLGFPAPAGPMSRSRGLELSVLSMSSFRFLLKHVKIKTSFILL